MVSQDFFKVPLKFLKFCGIAFEYPNGFKGTLMRLLYFASFFSLTFWTIAEVSYLIKNVDEFENNADTIVISISSFYALVQMFTFYTMNEELKELTGQLNELTELGKSFRQNIMKLLEYNTISVLNEHEDLVLTFKKKVYTMSKIRHAFGVTTAIGTLSSDIYSYLFTSNRKHHVNIGSVKSNSNTQQKKLTAFLSSDYLI